MVYGKRRSKMFPTKKAADAAIQSARYAVPVVDSYVRKVTDRKWEAKIVHHDHEYLVAPELFEGGGVEAVILSE